MSGVAMRRKDNPSLLRQIAHVRDLQRLAAEAEAARAAAALRSKTAVCTEAEQGLQSIEESWLASVRAPTVRVDIMPLWSNAAIEQGEIVRRANMDVEAAARNANRRVADWHGAVAAHDIAQELARDAAKDRA